jgi:hypothetical protein
MAIVQPGRFQLIYDILKGVYIAFKGSNDQILLILCKIHSNSSQYAQFFTKM